MSPAPARKHAVQPVDPAQLRRRIQSALEDGDTAYIREVLADPAAVLSDDDRAGYARLLRFSARFRPGEPVDARDEAAVRGLRPGAVAGWVALHEGKEIARGPVLKDVLAEARGQGVAAPRLVWLPAAEAPDGTDQA
jgi:hypothetical protein